MKKEFDNKKKLKELNAWRFVRKSLTTIAVGGLVATFGGIIGALTNEALNNEQGANISAAVYGVGLVTILSASIGSSIATEKERKLEEKYVLSDGKDRGDEPRNKF